MSGEELLRLLVDRGVDLWREGDRLRFRAPAGILTAELRDEVVKNRGFLLDRVPRLADGEPPFGLSPAEIAEFRALGVSVRIRSRMAGDFWIMPVYTGQDRPEVTPEDAGRLLRLLQTFPGSVVESFQWLRGGRRPAADQRDEEPQS